MDRWLPLAQYAIEEGISISTLRRKIKANSIEYKLDDGRYLIRSQAELQKSESVKTEAAAPVFVTRSSDLPPTTVNQNVSSTPSTAPISTSSTGSSIQQKIELEKINSELKSTLAQVELKWKALEVRVNGLAKRIDYLLEQNSELNMLVKVFEEKLNASL